jgi:hypothetical protein
MHYYVSIKDLDNDGMSEVVTVDLHGDSCTACRSSSLKVLRYQRGSITNVTAQFPTQTREDAYRLWKSFRPYEASNDSASLPAQDAVLAAYLADKYFLGEAEDGWRIVAATGVPREAIARIRNYLEQQGYTQVPQGNQNAEARRRFSLIELESSGQ